MKKLSIVLTVILCGCATPGRSPQAQAFEAYIAENRPKAEQGAMKWSAYFEGAYQHALETSQPGWYLRSIGHMIKSAREYEAGSITLDEFKDRRRAEQADNAEKRQVAAEKVQAERSARYAAAAAAYRPPTPLVPYVMPTHQPTPMRPLPASAGGLGFLKNQSVNGTLKYCHYSNGVVNTISSIDLCPMSTE